MKIALGQHEPIADVAAATAKGLDMVQRARAAGAEFLLLPEGSMHAFGADIDLAAIAQPRLGQWQQDLLDTGFPLVAGGWEPGVTNTLIGQNELGERVFYEKVHLYDSFGYRESDNVLAGNPTAVQLDVHGFRMGLMTCYDLRFPEFARLHAALGAQVLLYPAGWVAGERKVHHWRTLLTARAIENTCYVVAADLCQGQFVGHSMVIDPNGDVIAEAGEEEELLIADLSLDVLAQTRRIAPTLEHRRIGQLPLPEAQTV